MVLSGSTIEEMIDAGEIGVEPSVDDEQYQPASLDVRMGEKLYDVYRDEYIDADDGKLTLEPWSFYLGHTLSRYSMPNDVAAQLTGRSSFGREGIVVHKTAGWIDPGFVGKIVLEVFNFSLEPVTIEVSERVGQLVFQALDKPSHGYNGRYQHQTGIAESRR